MVTESMRHRWVVYKHTIHGSPVPMAAVCRQDEWQRMEARRPGYHKLIRADIVSEAEAERLARGTTGDAPPARPKSAAPPAIEMDAPPNEQSSEIAFA
jgi:hypothetical protein